MQDTPTPLTWGLTLATYMRHGPLLQCIESALTQTRPPIEIVVVDASQVGMQQAKQATLDLVARHHAAGGPAVGVHYVRSEIAQHTVQWNRAVAASSADVLFLIDDDTLLHPKCAEILLAVYESDDGSVGGQPPISAVSAIEAGVWPIPDDAIARAARIERGGAQRGRGIYWFRHASFRHGRPLRSYSMNGVPLRSVRSFVGAYMTARRRDAVAEPMNEAMVLNNQEDIDVSLRWLQRGALVEVRLPLMHHLQTPRADGQIRTGWLDRFSFCLNHAHTHRKGPGGSVQRTAAVLVNHLRFIAIDVARVIVKRRVQPLIGDLRATPGVLCISIMPRRRLAAYVIERSRAARAQNMAGRPPVT
ncbi:MAG: glycosyltransferase [Phycisphaerae bacterium]|nr:glycosyltransferase [Phycisphaerae bacterium]